MGCRERMTGGGWGIVLGLLLVLAGHLGGVGAPAGGDTKPVMILLDGRPVELPARQVGETIWVPLDQVARVAGWSYELDRQNRTVRLAGGAGGSGKHKGGGEPPAESLGFRNRYLVTSEGWNFQAELILNGKSIGTLTPYGQVDLTRWIRPGENQLLVRYVLGEGKLAESSSLSMAVELVGRRGDQPRESGARKRGRGSEHFVLGTVEEERGQGLPPVSGERRVTFVGE